MADCFFALGVERVAFILSSCNHKTSIDCAAGWKPKQSKSRLCIDLLKLSLDLFASAHPAHCRVFCGGVNPRRSSTFLRLLEEFAIGLRRLAQLLAPCALNMRGTRRLKSVLLSHGRTSKTTERNHPDNKSHWYPPANENARKIARAQDPSLHSRLSFRLELPITPLLECHSPHNARFCLTGEPSVGLAWGTQ